MLCLGDYICFPSFSLSWLVTGSFLDGFGICLNFIFALGACIFSLVFLSCCTKPFIHQKMGFSSSGEKSLLQDRSLFTGVWKFLPGAWSRAILSKDLCWNNGAESPEGGWTPGCHMEKFKGLRGKFWFNNSDCSSPARLAWCCPLFLSWKSHYWALGLLWVCMREWNFRDILVLSPSRIFGVSSALKCSCAGVEVLALGVELGFFLCLHTQGGKNPSIPWILPLKKNCKVKFP